MSRLLALYTSSDIVFENGIGVGMRMTVELMV